MRMVFNNFVLQPMKIAGGEDQGDPATGIGHILYAAGVLNTFRKEEKEEGFGFMDDILAAMKVGADLEETHKGLEELMTREGGVLKWAKKQNCLFGVNKFKLVDFTHRREKRKGGI